MTLVEQVRADPGSAPVPAKLKALLTIASAVRDSARRHRRAGRRGPRGGRD